MGPAAVLVANRGEIAVRVLRAAAGAGLRTAAVHAQDDADAAAVRLADEAYPLPGSGPAAYLDAGAVMAAARQADCGFLHPGYGFLSEDAGFARACAAAGVTFVGPSPEVLRSVRRQGARRGARPLAGSPGGGRDRGPDDPGAGTGLLRRTRRGRGGDGQGARRRRRAGNASGARSGASWRRHGNGAGRRRYRASAG